MYPYLIQAYRCARLLGLFLLFHFGALAQGLTVQGTVTDESNSALPGVTIVVKGTTTGVATDGEGNFSLPVPDGQENGTLVVSFVGYVSQQVPINGRTRVNVQLVPDVKALEEVVVVGYGTQQKKDLTGAISVIKPVEIQKRQATTVAEAMQGLATELALKAQDQAQKITFKA